jgi:hypothetical protein
VCGIGLHGGLQWRAVERGKPHTLSGWATGVGLGIELVGVTSVGTWLVHVVEWGTVARVNLADEAVAVVGVRERVAWRQGQGERPTSDMLGCLSGRGWRRDSQRVMT